MEKEKRFLKGYAYIFIFLAIWGVIRIFLDTTDLAAAVATTGLPEKTIMGIALGLAVVTGLVELFLGVKALKQIKGTVKGTGYITLAKVIFVFYVIGLISTIFAVINKTENILNLLTTAVSVIVLFDYIRISSKLKEQE